jgi:hypothetical protein
VIVRKRGARHGERVCLIKAVLSDWYGRVRGRPYRVLAVPEGFTLYGLGEAVVYAFDFCLDHAFGFYDDTKRWIDSRERYELFKDLEEEGVLTPDPDSTGKSVKRTRVSEVFNKVGKRMLFLFDYGDEWHFILKLKGIEPPKKDAKYPLTVKTVGEAPPQYMMMEEDDEPQ